MKKQLVSTVIVALITANATTAIQYKHDIKMYKHKVENQSKIIKSEQLENVELLQSVRSKGEELHITQTELDRVKKENKQLKTIISKKERVLNIKATAYISSCKGCSGTTYSEYPVSNTIEYSGLNIVATDTTVIPLYSIVRITTKDKSIYAIVLDKGGAIKNDKLDLLVSTYDTAIRFGRQDATVTILREGKGDLIN